MDNNYIILIAIAAAVFIIPKVFGAIRRISPDQANELVKNGALIVDVRQGSEFGSGHVKNAINIPLNSISKIAKKASKDQDIIVYCHSGARSNSASKQLKSLGYTKVHDMGPMHRWTNK